jgi:3',5'-nucleoside bisphosphate phosphatase
MKYSIVIFILVFCTLKINAQNLNNVQFPEMIRPQVRKEISIPDIPEYLTLKCDFHMHTVFSDGIVWPEVRVDEAWREGLDVIAITDHIENQPSKKFISGDHNSSFELAQKEAEVKNIILIHAGEITRSMPPGHLNALFITDANKLDVEGAEDALKEAKKQGAFIIWNHPGWKAQQPDTCLLMPMHEDFLRKGLINGIEVFNEKEYYPVTLDWCLKRKIAVIGTSDIHDITSMIYDLVNSHRPMTLVFAKSRTLESVKEAMFSNRTVAYFGNMLAGPEYLLNEIFKASVKIRSTGHSDEDKQDLFEVSNTSAIQYVIDFGSDDKLTLQPGASVIIPSNNMLRGEIKIVNLLTGTNQCLHTKFSFQN